MTGDIFPLSFEIDDHNNNNIIDDFQKKVIETYDCKGYLFKFFKDDTEISYSDLKNLKNIKNGDLISMILYPPTFICDISINDINSIMFESECDMTAWIRGDFYDKYIINIHNMHKDSLKDIHDFGISFYYKNNNTIFIPKDSVIIINEGKWDDEDHIVLIRDKPIFSNLKDMLIYCFQSEDISLNKYLCETIIDNIVEKWNSGEIYHSEIINLDDEYENM